MPKITELLKTANKLEGLDLTLAIVGSRKMYETDDFGHSPWSILAPDLIIYGFDADAEACEAANQALADANIPWREKHYPLALSREEGTSVLHITNLTACSSLYQPNESFCDRLAGFNEAFKVVATVEIETTTLDAFSRSQEITNLDYLQVDVQGADLDVIKGGSEIIRSSTLAVLVEVEFNPLYKDQPLFSDIDTYLRGLGFSLFDLVMQNSSCRLCRSISPITSATRSGQILWADAIYLRDLINPEFHSIVSHLQNPESYIKLAAIADILDFPDYSLEVLTHLTCSYGSSNERFNCSDVIYEFLNQFPALVESGLENLPIIQLLNNR